jgi:2-polyprenyl-3-methyl-5-hydroxy-6-metoxy-1,4-benzoquinol methylase
MQISKNFNYNKFHKKTTVQSKIIRDNNFTYRILLETINKYVNNKKSILDIGCGAGTLCLYYTSKGHKVLGVDISSKAVESAKQSAKFLNLKNAQFQTIPFPKVVPQGKFDFIIFTEVIEHLEDDDLALKKIFSILRPGGICVISTPSKNAPLHRLGLAKDFDKSVGHLRRYTLEELVKKSKSCGFQVLQTKKTEGIIRNFLFLNPIAGKFVRFIKFFLSDWATYIDNISLKLFGESNIFVVLKKP